MPADRLTLLSGVGISLPPSWNITGQGLTCRYGLPSRSDIHHLQLRSRSDIHHLQVRSRSDIHHLQVRSRWHPSPAGRSDIHHLQVRSRSDIHHLQVRSRSDIHHLQVGQTSILFCQVWGFPFCLCSIGTWLVRDSSAGRSDIHTLVSGFGISPFCLHSTGTWLQGFTCRYGVGQTSILFCQFWDLPSAYTVLEHHWSGIHLQV